MLSILSSEKDVENGQMSQSDEECRVMVGIEMRRAQPCLGSFQQAAFSLCGGLILPPQLTFLSSRRRVKVQIIMCYMNSHLTAGKLYIPQCILSLPQIHHKIW